MTNQTKLPFDDDDGREIFSSLPPVRVRRCTAAQLRASKKKTVTKEDKWKSFREEEEGERMLSSSRREGAPQLCDVRMKLATIRNCFRAADFARSKGRVSKGRRSSRMIAIFKIQCVSLRSVTHGKKLERICSIQQGKLSPSYFL